MLIPRTFEIEATTHMEAKQLGHEKAAQLCDVDDAFVVVQSVSLILPTLEDLKKE